MFRVKQSLFSLLLSLMLLSLLLAGCAVTPKARLSTVALSEHASYQLTAAPASLVGQGFLTLVKGRHGDNDYEFIVQVELNKNSIVMVGTTANGVSLFELVWYQDKPFELNQSILAKGIEVEYMLADFQLVHWPMAVINQQLRGATINGYDSHRVVSVSGGDNLSHGENGKKIIDIDYQPSVTSFAHHLRDYQLSITTLEKWSL
ncbi:MAG: hypothetical protein ACI8WB_003752 [Phenylobacterium sp.]|jgi:hypothetical protein